MKAKKYTRLNYHASLIALASCLSVVPSTLGAAELGRISVLSAFGQPLRAEIELSATAEELSSMTPRLAVRDAFRQAGVDYTPILQDLRFSIDKRGNGQPVIRVSSSRPVSDPFLDFLLELKWDGGQRVREYTFLLDPVEDAPRNAKPSVTVAAARGGQRSRNVPAAAAPEVTDSPESVIPEPKPGRIAPPPPPQQSRTNAKPAPAEAVDAAGESVASKPAKPAKPEKIAKAKPAAEPKAAKPAAPPKESKTAAAGQHQVAKGETLSQIARESLSEGISLEQMLVGIHRGNPDAFAARNINRLHSGAILNIPDRDAVAAISANEARQYIAAHSSNWNAYRQKLATAAEQAPARDEVVSQSGRGRIVPKVEEKPLPASQNRDQVKISRHGSDGKGKANAQNRGATEEELVAKEKALKEAQERLALLERNVTDLKKLVEVKNQTLAELEKRAQERNKPGAPAAKPETAPAAAVKPETPVPVAPTPPAAPAPKPEVPAVPPPAPLPAPVTQPATPVPVPVPPPVTDPAAQPAAQAIPPIVETPKAPEEAPPPVPPIATAPPPQTPAAPRSLEGEPEAEPEFIDQLMEDPMLPAAGGGVIALLLGFLLVRRRQAAKRAETAGQEEPSLSLPPLSAAPSSALAQQVDTSRSHDMSGSSIMASNTSDFNSQMGGIVDTGEVDPVAEADVYMAYGRDAQAEEILLEALQKDPQRTAIHVKLLEIYAKRGNQKQFETLAGELYSQTGGEGPDWARAAELGVQLDPGNPLFQQNASLPPPAADVSIAPPTLMDTPSEQSIMSFDHLESGIAPPVDPDPMHDFDLPPPDAPPLVPSTAAEMADEPVSQAPDEDAGLDFDLGLDLDAETEQPDQEALHAALNQALNLPDHPEILEPEEASGDVEADSSAMDFDFSGLELELENPDAGAQPAQPDVVDDDLGLEELPPAPVAEEKPIAAPARPQVKISISPLTPVKPAAPAAETVAEPAVPVTPVAPAVRGPHWEEVNTKLDLAKAYEEMGDLEGARELLNEVTSEGDADQMQQARTALARIG